MYKDSMREEDVEDCGRVCYFVHLCMSVLFLVAAAHVCSPLSVCVSVMKIDKVQERQVASSRRFLVSLSHYGNRLLPPSHTSVYLAFFCSPTLF